MSDCRQYITRIQGEPKCVLTNRSLDRPTNVLISQRNGQCVAQSINSLPVMEPEASLLCLQDTSIYLQPDWSSPRPSNPIYLKLILIFSSHLRLGLQSVPFHSRLRIKILYAFLLLIHATRPAHLPVIFNCFVLNPKYLLPCPNQKCLQLMAVGWLK